MSLQTIPLSKLVPSPANVRKTGGACIDDLAASIAAHGLLQNLQVRPLVRENGDPTGKYEVVAGGRRLAAMKRLAKERALPKNHPVPCRVLETEDAAEISLAENVIRQAMHPADQYEAFAALAAEGHDPETIATRFGTSATQVRKLLKLASVSPRLMQAYREAALTLEQLMAFTVSADHAAQERVYAEIPAWNLYPGAIRRQLTEAYVSAGSRLARFVGIEAYVAAGGAVLRDLFQEEHEGYLTDPALLERLAAEKLGALAETVRAEGWAWVEVLDEYRYPGAHGFRQLAPEERPLPDADQARLSALAAEYDALAEAEDEADADRLAALEAEITALTAAKRHWPDEVKRAAGAVVFLADDGAAEIVRGLMRKEAAEDLPWEDGPATPASAKPAERPTLSAALIEDLTAHRTAALRVVLTEQPDLALDALLAALAGPVFYGYGTDHSCLEIRLSCTDLRHVSEGLAEAPAQQRFTELQDEWRQRLPEDVADLPAWLAAETQETKLALLAACVAATLNAVQPRTSRTPAPQCRAADQLAAASRLDMADWWQPTRATYLGRVSKALILEALREAVSPACAENLQKLKREALIAAAEQRLAGKRWLPALLRAPAADSSLHDA